MPRTLDPIQSVPKQKRVRTPKHTRAALPPPAEFDTSIDTQQKKMWLMWIAVSASMSVVVVAWVLTIAWFTGGENTNENSNGGLFEKIGEKVRGVFSSEDETRTQDERLEETSSGDTEKLKELREYVFPEFQENPQKETE